MAQAVRAGNGVTRSRIIRSLAESRLGVSSYALFGVKSELPIVLFRQNLPKYGEHVSIGCSMMREHRNSLATHTDALVEFDPVEQQWDRVNRIRSVLAGLAGERVDCRYSDIRFWILETEPRAALRRPNYGRCPPGLICFGPYGARSHLVPLS